jgi:hypothetical protein
LEKKEACNTTPITNLDSVRLIGSGILHKKATSPPRRQKHGTGHYWKAISRKLKLNVSRIV